MPDTPPYKPFSPREARFVLGAALVALGFGVVHYFRAFDPTALAYAWDATNGMWGALLLIVVVAALVVPRLTARGKHIADLLLLAVMAGAALWTALHGDAMTAILMAAPAVVFAHEARTAGASA